MRTATTEAATVVDVLLDWSCIDRRNPLVYTEGTGPAVGAIRQWAMPYRDQSSGDVIRVMPDFDVIAGWADDHEVDAIDNLKTRILGAAADGRPVADHADYLAAIERALAVCRKRGEWDFAATMATEAAERSNDVNWWPSPRVIDLLVAAGDRSTIENIRQRAIASVSEGSGPERFAKFLASINGALLNLPGGRTATTKTTAASARLRSGAVAVDGAEPPDVKAYVLDQLKSGKKVKAQRRIAEALGVGNSTVSDAMRALEKSGEIIRRCVGRRKEIALAETKPYPPTRSRASVIIDVSPASVSRH